MSVTTTLVQKHLRGASYPAEAEDLIRYAENNDAPDEVIEALESLEPGTYDDPDEVAEALSDEEFEDDE